MSDVRIPIWTLGDRLAKAREWAGLSRADMAAHLDVHTNTISNYEHDNTHPPTGVVRAWATKCDVPYEWLADLPVDSFPWPDMWAGRRSRIVEHIEQRTLDAELPAPVFPDPPKSVFRFAA